MTWPAATEPRPSGRPTPSGRTSMSQLAIISGVNVRPRSCQGGAAAAGPARVASRVAPSTAGRRGRGSDLDIGDLPGGRHLPGLNRIVVVDRSRAANLAKLANRRLHVTRVVPAATLQQRRRAVPYPVRPEAGQRLR